MSGHHGDKRLARRGDAGASGRRQGARGIDEIGGGGPGCNDFRGLADRSGRARNPRTNQMRLGIGTAALEIRRAQGFFSGRDSRPGTYAKRDGDRHNARDHRRRQSGNHHGKREPDAAFGTRYRSNPSPHGIHVAAARRNGGALLDSLYTLTPKRPCSPRPTPQPDRDATFATADQASFNPYSQGLAFG